ncbi:hypothetical protein G7067_08315 [Leucobacter insecticola]|uniref:Uncharacterized protein n=1 Tax=Leucobacter insecticola TaxID=2714934 RepID=A0A6G8FJE9_9MICO|nr:hypothetical protein [Leucobacter insecticola]QIM16423.1 hypothetical protein G7067_08315 [Leucobacter insecticola]
MSDTNASAEQRELAAAARREAIRENTGTSIPGDLTFGTWQHIQNKYGDSPETRRITNGSLATIAWLSGMGFALAVVAIIVTVNTENPITLLIWSGLIGPSLLAGLIAAVAFFVTRAIITSRK